MAKQIYNNWNYLKPKYSYEDLVDSLHNKVNNHKEPIHIIAKIKEEFIAGAIIKLNEMEEFPQFKYWIGSVVVEPKHQGKNVATDLMHYCCKIAKERGIEEIYIQTEYLNGGLYNKLNWKPVCRLESKGDQVLVMKKKI